jgi:acyl-CoA synthetase (AMP-forming)/AMP-acid ligase II
VVFTAPEAPLSIPEVALTPLLLARAQANGDKPAFIDGQTARTITHRAWARAVTNTAASLVARGLRKGDVVALYSSNLPEYAVAFHAVSLVGGVTTLVSPLYTAGELESQLLDSDAKYVFTLPALVPRVQSCRCPAIREVFVFGDAEGVTSLDALSAAAGDISPAVLDPREDVVALPYSSGTSGRPKGVMLTHYNMVANALQAASALDVHDNDTLLALLPFFHIYGLGLINVVLYQGATAVVIPRFDPVQCLEVMRQYGVTYLPAVPPIVAALASISPDTAREVPTLRIVVSGAAPLNETIAAAGEASLGCPVIQGYGLTETSPLVHTTRIRGRHTGAGGVGPPVPNTESKIVMVDTGAECEPRQPGEICVRGPQVMKGYLNSPEATAATIDHEGWLHTGDLGYADEQGCFFIVDRLKDVIKVKGLQVAPAELEAVLMTHPAIADAAVIGVPDERAGEVPKAFVVLKGQTTAAEILEHVSTRVAPHKQLRGIEFIEQIPRSPAGKILRRAFAPDAGAQRVSGSSRTTPR